MGTTASLTLGMSVGAAFALMIVVLIAAYCIYTYKHPEKRPGHAGKVKPDNLAKMRENTDQPTVKKTHESFCLCCAMSVNDIVPPPDPPIKLELKDLQSNDVTISWKPPIAYAASRIKNYVIYVRASDKPHDWTRLAKLKSDAIQHLVQPLESDKRYVLGVASKNSGGESSIIETRPFILTRQTKPPAKPVGPIKYNKTTHSSVTFSWKTPTDDGGLPITGYAVSVLHTRNGEWSGVGVTAEKVTTFCVPKLPEDTEVRVKVSAMNEAGSSIPLIGGKVRTKLKETSSYGSKSQSSRSGQSVSTSSNIKLTRSALQRVLAHWEPSSCRQVPPTSTNSVSAHGNVTPKSNPTEKTRALGSQVKVSTSGLRTQPRLETDDPGKQQ